jgi:hypothetical protein
MLVALHGLLAAAAADVLHANMSEQCLLDGSLTNTSTMHFLEPIKSSDVT